LLPSSFIAGFAKKRFQRHLAIAHSADVHLLKSLPFKSQLAWRLLYLADHVGFVSHSLRREFLNALPKRKADSAAARSSVTPMGFDSAELTVRESRARLRASFNIHEFTVLFLGRLVAIKGVDLLLDALSKLTGISLVVAGDGPEKARLEKQATRLEVNARFVGAVDATRRAELLRACDVLVLSSRQLTSGRTEGLPLVVVEAQAAGLPVIASDTGAVSEVIDHRETGILVPPGNTGRLKEALYWAASDPNLLKKLKNRGRRAVQYRDWQQLLPLYENLLSA
jgi:glycosyltransferase involved in cell wall biosynthesis